MRYWAYCNPNPQGKEVDDCVIRALSVATGEKWYDIFDDIASLARSEANMPSANAVWDDWLADRGWIKHEIPRHLPKDYNVIDFCRNHPYGRFVLGLKGHVVAVIDGRYYDTWDSGERIIEVYWEYPED